MTDYKNIGVRQLEETVSLGVLHLVYLLMEAGIHRDDFRSQLDMINSGIAELAYRAEEKK